MGFMPWLAVKEQFYGIEWELEEKERDVFETGTSKLIVQFCQFLESVESYWTEKKIRCNVFLNLCDKDWMHLIYLNI